MRKSVVGDEVVGMRCSRGRRVRNGAQMTTLGAWLRLTRQVRLVSKVANIESGAHGVYVK
jgi:hypothetical protein